MRTRSYVLLPVLALAVSACGGDGPTDSDPPSGVVRFDHSGAWSGTFESRGPTQRADGTSIPPAEMQEFAGAGWTSAGRTSLRIVAGRRSTGGDPVLRFDLLLIDLSRLTGPGTYRFCRSEGPGCAQGEVYVGYDLYESGTAVYELEGGSLVVTELTQDRVRGTFQAPGTDLVARSNPGTIQVSGGTFDLELFPYEDPITSGMRR